MRNGIALLACIVWVALVAGTGLATAAPGEVVPGGIDLWASGKVVSKTADAIKVRTDDHGHTITFDISGKTEVARDVSVGSHVRVDYHPTGSIGQAADRVTVTPARRARR